MTKITNAILPATMVGSYPRPHWYRQQLLGRDIRVAFKEAAYEEASPEQVATPIRKVLQVVPPERVYVSTDCGMKALPRIVAKLELRALVQGAAIVRKEFA